MMTEQERIERFLQLQEQGGQMTDEQLQQALDDPQLCEMAEQVAFAKRALKNEELKSEEPDIDMEWEKFQAPRPTLSTHRWMKIAACFIGVLLVSGIAFAAIWIQNHPQSVKYPANEKSVEEVSSSLPHNEGPGENMQGEATSLIFDNIPLDSMLADMAAYYGAEVEYKSDATRQLRFHFVWKLEDGLSRAVEKLNHFESLSIRFEHNKIIVE